MNAAAALPFRCHITSYHIIHEYHTCTTKKRPIHTNVQRVTSAAACYLYYCCVYCIYPQKTNAMVEDIQLGTLHDTAAAAAVVSQTE